MHGAWKVLKKSKMRKDEILFAGNFKKLPTHAMMEVLNPLNQQQQYH